jgi:dihydrolipoamide dehydrogenase
LENTKVTVNQRGFIEVDKQLRTRDEHIFAIGDIAGDPMLAHKASHEALVAVEVALGHKAFFEPRAIPAVVFTDPEIAWAGLTETQARELKIPHEVAKFPWAAASRAVTLDRSDGVTKLIIEPGTERILGVAVCGPGAGELIAEGTLAIEMGATATDLKMTIHPHPTLSETIMEAAEVFFGECTHIYRPKK